ncbi:MAG: sodium:calcium antiporter, partial [Terriglobia bacterium]
MVSSLLFLLLGLAGLYFGADWLVRGAVRIAAVLHVRPLFIGLTVVAFGTSAPEIVVCVVAAVQGNTDIALGNVLGSNVANIGLILALTATLSPVQVARRLARREVPFMLVATLIFYALAWRLNIGRWEGALLVLGLVAFTRLALHWAQKDPSAMAGAPEELQQVQARRRRVRVLLDLALLTAGLLVLVIA